MWIDEIVYPNVNKNVYLLLECNDENMNKFDLIAEKCNLQEGKKIFVINFTSL